MKRNKIQDFTREFKIISDHLMDASFDLIIRKKRRNVIEMA